MKTLAERFWEKVEKTDGCWIWKGMKRGGYGRIGAEAKRYCALLSAHRVSWEIHNGPIPDGLIVCHICDNPPCVNPAHLFLGTKLDNALDAKRKGRLWNPLSDRNKAATHCPQGHEYSVENTYSGESGRKCKTCVRARRARYRALHRVRINAQNAAAARARRANHSRQSAA